MASLALRRALVATSQRAVAGRKAAAFSTLLNLEDEYPGLPSLSPQPAKATAASVSTLANGLTVVTEGACNTSTVTMTYPKAGSAEEMLDEQGAALINKCLAFKSGSGMSSLVINRTIEDAGGGIPFATADRRGATLGFTVTPDKATTLIHLLAVDCSFEKWDMRDAKHLAQVICTDAATSAQIVLTENLFAAAYGAQSAAGRTFYECSATPSDLIKSFRARSYGLNGAILTATGVTDHAAFCTEAAELLAGAPSGPSVASSSSPIVYMGGESRVAASSSGGYAHVALAFEAPASSVVANVIKHVLSLTGSSSGVAGFATTGLVGVYAGSDETAGIVDAMSAVLTTKSTPDLLKRAKRSAKAEALFALDGGSKMLAQAMTAGVLETGSFGGPAAIAKAYDAVSEKDLSAAITAMLKTNPSLAAVGDISLVPYHANIAGRFA